MRKPCLAFSIVLSLLLANSVSAWNGTGHMTVAFIAYQNLNHTQGHDTRARVNALLRRHPDFNRLAAGLSPQDPNFGLIVFMRAAVWPDSIKKDPRFFDENDRESQPKPTLPGFPNMKMHKMWHYYDEPFNPDGSPTQPVQTPNALQTINWFRDAIGNQNVSPEFQAYDLSWLIHLVGDVHQPLHCIARFTHLHSGPHFPDGDRGGNEFKIQPFTPPGANFAVDNLHSFWDDILGVRIDNQFIGSLGSSLPTPSPSEHPIDLVTLHWIQESNEIARTFAYTLGPDEPNSPKPAILPAYFNHTRDVAARRVALAGHRLARILNERLP